VARAACSDSDIVLLDDPLSALDANVGHHLLHQCILRGPLATRTRILVTHHLDVLPQADWIVVMDSKGEEGRISQQGTYRVGCRFTRSYRSTLTPVGTAQCRWAIPIVGERVWICFGRSQDRAYRRSPNQLVNYNRRGQRREGDQAKVGNSTYARRGEAHWRSQMVHLYTLPQSCGQLVVGSRDLYCLGHGTSGNSRHQSDAWLLVGRQDSRVLARWIYGSLCW
jgi:energy-coupling factor transporter ATP-binding protein EcfA2